MAERTVQDKVKYNYFEQLGLDSTCKDNAVIEMTIQTKIKEWQRKNSPLLKYRDDIREVMLNPLKREEEAKAYEEKLEDTKRGIIGKIHTYLSGGTIDSIQLERLLYETKQRNNIAFVKSLLQQEKVKVIDFKKEFSLGDLSLIEKLIEVHALLIKSRDVIRDVMGDCNNLFDFLSADVIGTCKTITSSSNVKDIEDRISAIYDMCAAKDKMYQNSTYVSISDIAKKTKLYLKCNSAIEFYGRYYKLFSLYDEIVFYSEEDYSKKLKKAQENGATEQQAQMFLRYCYSMKNIVIDSRSRSYTECPECHNFYDRGEHKSKCPHCGSEVESLVKDAGTVVYLSCLTPEKQATSVIKSVLEMNGVHCVLDAESTDGTEFAKALGECKMMILLLANKVEISEHMETVLNEAVRQEKIIIPFVLSEDITGMKLEKLLRRVNGFISAER